MHSVVIIISLMAAVCPFFVFDSTLAVFQASVVQWV